MSSTESLFTIKPVVNDPLAGCHYAYGKPSATAILRQRPEDFQVDEVLGFEPDGEGNHVFLKLRKRGQNTQWLANEIAHLAGIKERDIGYGGMKDRHAVTTQWFSVDVAGREEPDWSRLEFDRDSEAVEVIDVARHRRKLRRGTLTGNQFRITLRDLRGDHDAIISRLESVRRYGVPNYFGEQRFGANNLARAEAMFKKRFRAKRNQRSLYLSVARSQLFNNILSRRVADKNWNTLLDGDVMQLSGSHSVFKVAETDMDTEQRLFDKDIHPTGSLWGRGELMTSLQAQALELEETQQYPLLCIGLEEAGLKQQRRSLRLLPENMEWELSGDSLMVTFFLPAGSYATVVLREIVDYRQL